MIVTLPLDALDPHPDNCNVMSPDRLAKLADHIRRTGQYPPLIVRPAGLRHQLLDGHHRAIALGRIGHTHAQCVVWQVDDAQALLLLATLNRLQGEDDLRQRGRLVCELARLRGCAAADLAALLPEDRDRLNKLAALTERPALASPRVADQLPQSLHFFVTSAQKQAIEDRLTATGLARSDALLHLLGLETVR